MIDLATLVEGEIIQIDYDEQGRITVIHVDATDGSAHEIRFTYPGFMRALAPGQTRYAILAEAERPEVSVVRLA